MAHDPGRRRFFGQLNLFVTAMLLLVLGNNFVMLYLGWEGVGLASYLLIGWYQDRPSAATAAKKAFLMNRVGDVGLAIAIFLIWTNLGTLQYTRGLRAGRRDVRRGASSRSRCCCCSAPAASPASSRCRPGSRTRWRARPRSRRSSTPRRWSPRASTSSPATNPIYDQTETGRLVVAIIGAITLLIGAIIGCAYDDIKKVLAYSTVSQIGYMFLAVGLGPAGYALGIFHLLTHGFFKAGLFLGAGSVMHAMHDEVDMRRFGGLARYLPVTFVTFGLGYLALIGFPFLSGYYSKDAIIEAAFAQEGWQGWVFGGAATLAAGLTAFYMTRLVLMTFFGERRWKQLQTADGQDYHPHESPAVDDGSDDRAGVRVHRRRLRCSRRSGSPSGSPRRSASWPSPRAPVPSPHAVMPWLVIAFSALGVLIAWADGRAPPRPGREARPRLAARAGRAPRPVRERDQRGAHRPARHLADPGAGLLRQPRRGRAGQRHRPRRWAAAPAGCAGCRPASSARTR